MYIIFTLCCVIIRILAILTGYSYETINAFLFIYLEPLIIIITGIIAQILSNSKIMQVLNIFYIAIFINIIEIYGKYSLHNACLKAYSDLEFLGKITGLGYVNINLFLFIILFLFILIINIYYGTKFKFRSRNIRTLAHS